MFEISRTFNLNDQIAFSEISGDYNPIHLDELCARRSIFGEIIIHGMHLVLWALNEKFNNFNNINLSKINVNFLHGVPLNNKVNCIWEDNIENSIARIFIEKKLALVIEIYLGESSERLTVLENRCPPKEKPEDSNMDKLINKKKSLDLFFPEKRINNIFPNISKKISPLQISTFLATSRLIGNKCPGLHSIFTNINLNFKKSYPINNFSYSLSNFDSRFGLASINFKSPNSDGFIEAFQRPKPIIQKSYREVKTRVKNNEFSGINALVIGGSRGLGEVATKILCAGGASVTFTYFSGKEEAQIIFKEIDSLGGKINFNFFDVSKTDLFNNNNEDFDLIVYMATPFIFSGSKGKFNIKNFKIFCEFYIYGFLNLLNKIPKNKETKVLYPSSVAIDEIPSNMGEYSAAKAAGEMMCSFLEKNNSNLKINCPRLHRLETDQTASIIPQNLQNSIDIILKAIKETLGRK